MSTIIPKNFTNVPPENLPNPIKKSPETVQTPSKNEIIKAASNQILSSANKVFSPKCPLNKSVTSCQDKVNKWVEDLEMITLQEQLKYSKARFSRLMGGAHPGCSEQALTKILSLVTFLFINDDINEAMEPKALKPMNARNIAVFKGSPSNESDLGLTRAFADVRDQLKMAVSPGWFQRLTTHFEDHFNSNVWEAENRHQNRVPTYEEYDVQRDDTGAVKVVLDLIELAEGIEFENTQYDQLFSKINRCTNKIICLANDIFTAAKESNDRMNYLHNVVCVLETHDREIKGCPNSFEKAVAKTVLIHNQFVDDFIKYETELLKQYKGHPDESKVKAYLQALRDWMNSHYHWSVQTSRCQTDFKPEQPYSPVPSPISFK